MRVCLAAVWYPGAVWYPAVAPEVAPEAGEVRTAAGVVVLEDAVMADLAVVFPAGLEVVAVGLAGLAAADREAAEEDRLALLPQMSLWIHRWSLLPGCFCILTVLD